MSLQTKNIKAVLFDLDGTLIDTAADIASAINAILISLDRAKLSDAQVRSYAGKGAKGLLELGLQMGTDDPDYELRSNEFLNYYEKYMLETSRLFAGMEQVLEWLDEKKIPWGIVTNKPHRFTVKILEGLLLHHRAACVVSGDSLKNSKPHPEPILHACKLLNVEPSDVLYIGDAEIDIIASHAAGVTSIAALYGYITEGDDPQKWNAHGYINHPSELLEWLSENRRS
jgi:2-phosphoglycolate phosphatase